MSASSLPTIGALLGLFLGGAAIGVGLARFFAPHSWLADLVSFFALPVAFTAGLQAWYGLALLGLMFRLLRRPVSGVHPATVPSPSPRQPSGSFVFLPLSSGTGALAGLLVGLMSPTSRLWLVLLVYWLVGTVYGLLAWRLAQKGVLLPPESA